MRRIRTVAVFPTMFTLGNLVCGFFAIVVASRVEKPTAIDAPISYADVQNVMFAGWLIFLAMIFDALDGHVARLARTASDFGAQLDSLSDVVTFGVAPGFLLVKMCPRFSFQNPEVVWIIAAAYAACAALRLARFNVETGEEDDHLHFSGLPSPAAAAAIAGFAIMFHELRREGNNLRFAATIDWAVQSTLPFFAVIVGLLMVSRIPYPHVINQAFRGQRSFGFVVALLFSIVAAMIIHGYSLPIIACAFVLGPPVRFAFERVFHAREEQESIF